MGGRTRRWIASAVVIVAAGVGTATLRAQGGNPIEALTSSVGRILALLNPAPGPVTLSTPSVWVTTDEIVFCRLTNVGTETIAPLEYAQLDDQGQVLGSGGSTFVAPGQSRGGGLGGLVGSRRCEFYFHGTAAGVRAALSIRGPDDRVRLIVDAR
jgi:hypothetical protein